MKLISKIFNFAKKIISKIADMFKGKNPVEVINDTVKTVATVGTTALAVYAGVNAIRVHLIPARKSSNNNVRKSGDELLREGRESGSIEERLAQVKTDASNLGKKSSLRTSLREEELAALNNLAKSRNAIFQSLPPEDQLDVLNSENFDFQEYLKEYRASKQRPLFPWGKRVNKNNASQTDNPFREEKDYGFFNFIMRPLDDFYHWLINDPVPKKVPQLQLVPFEEIPSVPCEYSFDLLEIGSLLDPYYKHRKRNHCETNAIDSMGLSLAEVEKNKIYAEELFRHKSYKKEAKAIRRRLMDSKYNKPNILDFMDEDDYKKKKKKNKKKSKKKEKDFYRSSVMDSESKKRKKKKSKEDQKLENEADRRARKVYEYYLGAAMKGDIGFAKEEKFS